MIPLVVIKNMDNIGTCSDTMPASAVGVEEW